MKNIIFLTLLVIIFLLGCRPNDETCDIKTLILEDDFFPGTVVSDPIVSPIADAPNESALRTFYVKTEYATDGIQQYIMKFGYVYRASNFFENREKQSFKTDESEGQWETPENLVSFDFAADQSHVACGIAFLSKTCRWLARYEDYYVYLRSDISENGMTVDVFSNAVKEIDTRMVQCLGE